MRTPKPVARRFVGIGSWYSDDYPVRHPIRWRNYGGRYQQGWVVRERRR